MSAMTAIYDTMQFVRAERGRLGADTDRDKIFTARQAVDYGLADHVVHQPGADGGRAGVTACRTGLCPVRQPASSRVGVLRDLQFSGIAVRSDDQHVAPGALDHFGRGPAEDPIRQGAVVDRAEHDEVGAAFFGGEDQRRGGIAVEEEGGCDGRFSALATRTASAKASDAASRPSTWPVRVSPPRVAMFFASVRRDICA